MQYSGNFAGISDKLTTKLVILRGKVFTVSPKFTKKKDFGVVVPPGSKKYCHIRCSRSHWVQKTAIQGGACHSFF